MFSKLPFYIPDRCVVDVRNLSAAVAWYKEKLGLRESRAKREEDSGRPFADMEISSGEPCVSLVELAPGTSASTHHAIVYAKKLEKAHQRLLGRGVAVEPITTDSGGNRLFRFRDLDGNPIEVCVEP